jgi:phytoene dehydrogenase-like protein
VRRAGGRVVLGTAAEGIVLDGRGRVAGVRLAGGRFVATRSVVAAVPLAVVAALLPRPAPFARRLGATPERWGAFMAYLALPPGVVPEDIALHHQMVAAYGRDGSYETRKVDYAGRLRAALERVLPGAWDRARFVELATPHTFAHYTGRLRGLVGGTPQTPWSATLGAASHHSGIAGLVLAGDTVFPGQSTVGATLSGVAAARAAGASPVFLRDAR